MILHNLQWDLKELKNKSLNSIESNLRKCVDPPHLESTVISQQVENLSEFPSWDLDTNSPGWCYGRPSQCSFWWWLQYPRVDFSSTSQKLLELLLSF